MKPRLWVAALLSLIGICIVLGISVELYESALGYKWPQATGKVIMSEVRSQIMEASKSKYRYYWPEVQYRYQVGRMSYSGNRVRFSQHGMDQDEAKRVVAMYPSGKIVAVHYDPDDPEAAVLEQGIFWRLIPFLILGMGFSMAFFIALAMRRRKVP